MNDNTSFSAPQTVTFDKFMDMEYAVGDCYRDFCGACMLTEPAFHGAAGDLAGIEFLRNNVAQHLEIARRYGFDDMPTVFFRRGENLNDGGNEHVERRNQGYTEGRGGL